MSDRCRVRTGWADEVCPCHDLPEDECPDVTWSCPFCGCPHPPRETPAGTYCAHCLSLDISRSDGKCEPVGGGSVGTSARGRDLNPRAALGGPTKSARQRGVPSSRLFDHSSKRPSTDAETDYRDLTYPNKLETCREGATLPEVHR